MPIIDLQRRLREVGRIRLGRKVKTQRGTLRPAKLDKFRLTSQDRPVLEAAAQQWGGKVASWDGPEQGEQWEVIIEAPTIPVIVPPSDMAFSQFYEAWTGGGCVHRCDGQWDMQADSPCSCDPENRACKATTRLSLLVPDLPTFGVWRLETHGWHAAVELAGVVELCRDAGQAGRTIPAKLGLAHRSAKGINEKTGEPETYRFVVPTLDIPMALALGGGGMAPPALADLHPLQVEAAPASPAPPAGWQPVGELPEAPLVTVEDQMAEVQRERKPRKGAVPLPPTGLPPGGAAAEACDYCGEPYGEASLTRNKLPAGKSRYVHAACVPSEGKEEPRANDVSDPSDVGTGGDGRGGTSSGAVGLPATEPASVVPPPTSSRRVGQKAMTSKQRSMMFALIPRAVAGRGEEDLSGLSTEEAAAHRQVKVEAEREALLELCDLLGAPGLMSRKEIGDNGPLGSRVLDFLQATVVDNEFVWRDAWYFAGTGEKVTTASMKAWEESREF